MEPETKGPRHGIFKGNTHWRCTRACREQSSKLIEDSPKPTGSRTANSLKICLSLPGAEHKHVEAKVEEKPCIQARPGHQNPKGQNRGRSPQAVRPGQQPKTRPKYSSHLTNRSKLWVQRRLQKAGQASARKKGASQLLGVTVCM